MSDEEFNSLWVTACIQSNRRYVDVDSWIPTVESHCSEDDGEPCRFLRAVPDFTGRVIGYVCLFNKCVKRYPEEQDLNHLK